MTTSHTSGKFEGFEQMIQKAHTEQVDAVLIHHPQVLGDTYVELVENLNKLADAGLMLRIVPRADRKS